MHLWQEIPTSKPKIHVDSWRNSYSGIVPKEILDQMSYGKQKEKWEKRLFKENFKSECMYVLEVDEEIIGFSSGNIVDEDRAIINTIYFELSVRGKGYGAKLFNYMRRILRREIIEVWCFEDNTYRTFYEKMGGKFEQTQMVEICKKNIMEIQYIFSNIRQ